MWNFDIRGTCCYIFRDPKQISSICFLPGVLFGAPPQQGSDAVDLCFSSCLFCSLQAQPLSPFLTLCVTLSVQRGIELESFLFLDTNPPVQPPTPFGTKRYTHIGTHKASVDSIQAQHTGCCTYMLPTKHADVHTHTQTCLESKCIHLCGYYRNIVSQMLA